MSRDSGVKWRLRQGAAIPNARPYVSLIVKAKHRYEIRDRLGEGGMGIVYLAFDRQMKREVALKTIRDIRNTAQLDLFYKEWDLLKTLTHPNIIEVFDVGILDEEKERKPYFVMPLLKGVTLQELIRTSSRRLTVSRAIDIISQACRGLQAAHDAGLIHRDMKPSNIFVLEDDSVKIIDFGVARVVDVLSETGWKGTLAYMSPEQVQLKPVSPASDIFSLGVVAYEAFVRRRPFEGRTERDIVDAILGHIPPPVSTANPEVNDAVGRVVHKAMAKNPLHRFASARELADTLQKAFRGEPIEMFDRARIRPRIDRANRAFEEKDFQLAAEILRDLECEGHIDSDVSSLRVRVEQIVRQKNVQRLVDTARARLEEREYLLALQKIDEALDVDPDNTDAMRLRRTVESQRTEETIQDWFRLARQHIDNFSFDHARAAVDNVLKLNPGDTQGRKLLTEIQHREQEHLRIRQEKERLFRVAQETWQHGEVSSALSKLERLLELERAAPGRTSSERGNAYLSLYNEVRSEHDLLTNAYAEGRRLVSDGNLAKAKALCDQYTAKYPGNALFQGLRFDVEELLRQERSALIVETDKRVETEPDLGRRVAILEEALKQCPGEAHFEHALNVAREKRDFVQSIVARANHNESQGQFAEAIDQWKILRSVYSEYPGLEFEIDRLSRRRDQQQRTQAKARWVDQADLALETGDFTRALDLLQSALAEFPDDAELLQLRELARQGLEKAAEAQRLQAEAQALIGRREFERSAEVLHRALELDSGNSALKVLLAESLAEQARAAIESDRAGAERLIQQSLELDPNQPKARGLLTIVQDKQRDEYIGQCRTRVRQMQIGGNLAGAAALLDEALRRYPGEPQLDQLRSNLSRAVTEERSKAVERLRQLSEDAAAAADSAALSTIHTRARNVAEAYPNDRECQSLVRQIEHRMEPTRLPAEASPTDVTEDIGATQLLPRPGGRPLAGMLPALRRMMERARRQLSGGGSRLAAFFARERGAESGPPGAGIGATVRAAVSRPVVWIPAVLVLAVLGVLLVYRFRPQPPVEPQAPTIVEVDVRFETAPAGAELLVGGQSVGRSPTSVRLKPGTSYQLVAQLEGYKPRTVEFVVPADGSPVDPVVATLDPEEPRLVLTADLDSATAALDDEEPSPLVEMQKSWDQLTPQPHSLKFAAAGVRLEVAFDAPALALPTLSGKLPALRGATAVAVSSYRDTATVHVTSGLKVALFGNDMETPITAAEIQGTEDARYTNLSPGKYTLKVGEGDSERTMEMSVAAVPQLAMSVIGRTTASLRVYTVSESNERLNGVRIYLNDGAWRRPTADGRVTMANLSPGDYRVRVAPLPGYQTPPEQSVKLGKGQTLSLTFKFPSAAPAAPAEATLKFEALPEHVGAAVLLDDEVAGRVEKAGPFALTVKGSDRERRIAIQQERYQLRTVSRKLAAGAAVTLSPEEVRLIPTFGRVTPRFQPANLSPTLSYRPVRPGAQFAIIGTDRPLELNPGEYEFRAVAAGYENAQATVVVRADQHYEVVLAFRELAKSFGMSEFEDSGKWQNDRGWLVRKGDDFVKYTQTPATGRFSFDWFKQSGWLRKGKVLRWAIGLLDEKNYLAFEFDGDKLVRSVFVDGKERERQEDRRKAQSTSGPSFRVSITVDANTIVTAIEADQRQILVNTWAVRGRDLSKGQFAFRLPGSEEVSIANFEFMQRK